MITIQLKVQSQSIIPQQNSHLVSGTTSYNTSFIFDNQWTGKSNVYVQFTNVATRVNATLQLISRESTISSGTVYSTEEIPGLVLQSAGALSIYVYSAAEYAVTITNSNAPAVFSGLTAGSYYYYTGNDKLFYAVSANSAAEVKGFQVDITQAVIRLPELTTRAMDRPIIIDNSGALVNGDEQFGGGLIPVEGMYATGLDISGTTVKLKSGDTIISQVTIPSTAAIAIDATPTSGHSANLVYSGGVYAAIQNAQSAVQTNVETTDARAIVSAIYNSGTITFYNAAGLSVGTVSVPFSTETFAQEVIDVCEDAKDDALNYAALAHQWATFSSDSDIPSSTNNSKYWATLAYQYYTAFKNLKVLKYFTTTQANLPTASADYFGTVALVETGNSLLKTDTPYICLRKNGVYTWSSFGGAAVSIATTAVAGIVKPDGQTITVDANGLIKAAIAIATAEAAGIVRPDGSSITIDDDGTIHACVTDAYTKAEVDQMLEDMSELLISSTDQSALYAAVNALMGETTSFTGLGASIMAIDTLADEILS